MIYFDNASTYINNHQEVLDVFVEYNKKYLGNPSSAHRLGQIATNELNNAKNEVLKLLKLSNDYEVIFNSGATEGINHALKGYAHRNKTRGNEIIAFKNEHPAVINTLSTLSKEGFKINYINPDHNGEVNYEEIKQQINKNTIMVIVMSVNNEVGTINDLKKVKEIIKDYPKCILFSDVTQSITKVKEDYSLLDMFAFSAHKFGGLIGSGILVKKKKILLDKLIDGGNQQNDLRSGTVALPLILSTVYAIKKAMSNLDINYKHAVELNNLLRELLKPLSNDIVIHSDKNIPYITSFSLVNKKASVVLEALSRKEIYVSTKSACHEKSSEVSYVIKNMGYSDKLSTDTIRVSFSESNTLEEVKTFVNELKNIIMEIRG